MSFQQEEMSGANLPRICLQELFCGRRLKWRCWGPLPLRILHLISSPTLLPSALFRNMLQILWLPQSLWGWICQPGRELLAMYSIPHEEMTESYFSLAWWMLASHCLRECWDFFTEMKLTMLNRTKLMTWTWDGGSEVTSSREILSFLLFILGLILNDHCVTVV